ncbi:unnamed protein product [Ixodes pacificus]
MKLRLPDTSVKESCQTSPSEDVASRLNLKTIDSSSGVLVRRLEDRKSSFEVFVKAVIPRMPEDVICELCPKKFFEDNTSRARTGPTSLNFDGDSTKPYSQLFYIWNIKRYQQ